MTTEQKLTDFAEAVATDVKALYTRTNTYEHNQMVPNTIWTVNHNLGKFPSVEIVDSGGTAVVGSVDYVDDNQIIIEFTFAFSGKAYLN